MGGLCLLDGSHHMMFTLVRFLWFIWTGAFGLLHLDIRLYNILMDVIILMDESATCMSFELVQLIYCTSQYLKISSMEFGRVRTFALVREKKLSVHGPTLLWHQKMPVLEPVQFFLP